MNLQDLVGKKIAHIVEHDAHGAWFQIFFEDGTVLSLGQADSMMNPDYLYKETLMFAVISECKT